MWILKLSGFPFPPTFLSSSPTHPPLPLNQLTQSDCLDFVLCILFSYTPLFLPSPKRGVLPKSTYLSVKLQKSTFCFSSDVNSLVFVWRLAHIVGAFQSCLIQVRNRHSLKCTLQHYRKCNLMMLNCILLFRFCFFQFGELRNERKWISLSGRKIRKRPFSFANYLQKSWFRLESPYKQTPLNYANPHAQVIISSPRHLSPPRSSFPMRTQRRKKGEPGWFLFWYFENLVPFVFLSANEKWKKWIIFLYLFREKNYLTLYQFELLTP